jgi:hypothetical protein
MQKRKGRILEQGSTAFLFDCGYALTKRAFRAKLRKLKRDQWTRHPSFGAIEEEAHAKCFRALHGDQAHLSADVVSVLEPGNLCFIVIGVAFQALHAVFERLAESGADFEAILQGGIVHHGRHLWSGYGPQFFICGLKFFPTQPILPTSLTFTPDYGVAGRR